MASQCLQISYLSLAYHSTSTPPLIPCPPPPPTPPTHYPQFITCFFRTPCNPDLMFIQRNPGGRVSFHPVEGFFSSEKDALAHLLGMNSSPSFPRIRFLKYFKKKKYVAQEPPVRYWEAIRFFSLSGAGHTKAMITSLEKEFYSFFNLQQIRYSYTSPVLFPCDNFFFSKTGELRPLRQNGYFLVFPDCSSATSFAQKLCR